MSSRSTFFSLLLSAVVLTVIWSDRAEAIPAFSRQYKTECSTCHTIYPELNEYGEAFLKNAYVYTGKTHAGQEPEAPAGAGKGGPEGKDESGRPGERRGSVSEGIWLSGIPELVPISLTATQNLSYDAHPVNGDELDLSTRALVLSAGGAFRDKAGFFITYTAFSEGRFDPSSSNTPLNNSTNIGELFLVWRHAFDTPVNLKAGRFKPKLSLWKASNNVTVSSLAPQVYRVGRSLFTVDSPEDGLEANAIIGSRLFAAGGVVNRKGQNTKEGYGHLSYKFGGADFLGHEPVIDFDSDSVWDYLSATVGAYGYYGRNAVNDIGNYYYRTGADLDLLYQRLRLRLSGVKGRDSNPDFLSTKATLHSFVLASEVEYLFGSQVIGAFRYEYQDDGAGITRRYIPTVAYAPLQNTRLVLEYQYEAGPASINRIALLGLTFSL
ncbi:MAG: OprO/OprP family phosphate-selective porin [Geobacteraceae bacterium]|nr:OprO/OprP family phosphate-selective porin [Geobacteraceae bacterium]